jgi:DNA transposition AAA+ family ATPase
MTGAKLHGSYNCKWEIVDHLGANLAPIIVDEADRLDMKRIEDLRDINEATGVPVALIGEEGFFPKLKSRQRIYSRVAEVINFAPVEKDDVILYAAQAAELKVDPEAAAFLAEEAHGSFRLVHNFVAKLEGFAKASQVQAIDLDVLAGAGLVNSGTRKKGGRK